MYAIIVYACTQNKDGWIGYQHFKSIWIFLFYVY